MLPRLAAAVSVLFPIYGCVAQPPAPSMIKSDETIVLWPTYAVRDVAQATPDRSEPLPWRVTVHAWVFERERDSRIRAPLIEGFGREIGLTDEQIASPRFRDRAGMFICDNERGKQVGIVVPGLSPESATFILPKTSADGHSKSTITLSDAQVQAALAASAPVPNDAAQAKPEMAAKSLLFSVSNADRAECIIAPVQFLEPEGLSVVCDIDDTIKVSNVLDRDALLRGTFIDDYKPVDGMPGLCGRLRDAGASFHYVSASPWQLYEPLAEFMKSSGYPAGSFSLREFRMKDSRVLNLFKDPAHHKLTAIRQIMDDLPRRRFVLIGDTSESDAEIYATLAKERPGRVAMIAIRTVPGDEAGKARAVAALKDLPQEITGIVFDKPAEVPIERMTGQADSAKPLP